MNARPGLSETDTDPQGVLGRADTAGIALVSLGGGRNARKVRSQTLSARSDSEAAA